MNRSSLFRLALLLCSFSLFNACQKQNGPAKEDMASNKSDLSKSEILELSPSELNEYYRNKLNLHGPSLLQDRGPSPEIDCEEEAGCTTGVELLELVPTNPNYRWRVDIVRTSQNVTSAEEYWHLPISEQCAVAILADPVTAAIAIANGIPNVISVASTGIAYQLPYFELQNYWMFANLSPDGTADIPELSDYVKIRMYHRFGWDCFEIHDQWAAYVAGGEAAFFDVTYMWTTTTCEDREPPHTGNVKCPL